MIIFHIVLIAYAVVAVLCLLIANSHFVINGRSVMTMVVATRLTIAVLWLPVLIFRKPFLERIVWFWMQVYAFGKGHKWNNITYK